jgi:hypothetical protein
LWVVQDGGGGLHRGPGQTDRDSCGTQVGA